MSSRATRKNKRKKGRSDGLLKRISHEVRMDILRILYEREASPNEIAKETGQELKSVSYHVRTLREDGAIKQTRTEPRRGAVEHYYRAATAAEFDDEGWAKIPLAARQRISRTVLQVLFSEVAAAEHEGTLDARLDRHLSWMPFPVDEEGWEELTEVLAEAFDKIKGIKAASAARLAKTEDPGQPVIAALMGFERAANPSDKRN